MYSGRPSESFKDVLKASIFSQRSRVFCSSSAKDSLSGRELNLAMIVMKSDEAAAEPQEPPIRDKRVSRASPHREEIAKMLRPASLVRGINRSRRFCSSVNDVKAARKAKFEQAAAAHSPKTAGSVIRPAAIASILGLTGYALYEINYNPEGQLATTYFSSWFHQMIKDQFVSRFTEPVEDRLLPDWPTAPCYGNPPPGTPAPPLLVVDLERTLIASVHDAAHGWRHVKRPGVDNFINSLSQYYEMVIFSENDINMVQEVLLAIDKDNKCHKLGITAGEIRGEHVLKRLDLMNRDPARIIVIDDDTISTEYCARNTLLVKPFVDVDDKSDSILFDLVPLLQAFIHEDVKDFRDKIDGLGTHEAEDAITEYRMRLAKRRAAEQQKRNRGLGGLIRGAPTAVSQDDGFTRSVLPSPTELVGAAPDGPEPAAAPRKHIPGLVGASTRPQGEAVKKKGALFSMLDESAKRTEEEEKARREKMNEIYQQRMAAKAAREQQQRMLQDD